MAFSWKSDTTAATSNVSKLAHDSSTAGKAGMYGLVNNANVLVEIVNNSNAADWTNQGVSKPSTISTITSAFCNGEKATASDFNSFRDQVATFRNKVGTDSKIYCAVALTSNYTGVQSSLCDDYFGTKYDCTTHNATYKSNHDSSK